nr:hypothetical protein [uncultured Desulfobulbus sp.]
MNFKSFAAQLLRLSNPEFLRSGILEIFNKNRQMNRKNPALADKAEGLTLAHYLMR